MPSLIIIDPRQLDHVWPIVGPMLASALNTVAEPDVTIDQVQLQIRAGACVLVAFMEGEEPIGAATVEFINYPRRRVAHINTFAGRGIATPEVYRALGQWCRSQGACEMQGWCTASRARLYRRLGFREVAYVVRAKL